MVSLLADEQDQVARAAWDALLEAGEAAEPYLQEVFDAADIRLRVRARALLEELRLREREERWIEYVKGPREQLDLERGCLLLAGITGAEVKERSVDSFLGAIAGTVRAHMAGLGGLGALREVLFDNLGFRGGRLDDPDNHFLPTVLERRTGVSIALTALYMIVGQRVGLPVFGVAMPEHFLALYLHADEPTYVDCFNRGQVYRREVLQGLLLRRGSQRPEQVLAPCSNRFILYRMLNNLDRLYTEKQNRRLAERARRWLGHLVREGEPQA